jgi:hypothetical protein
MTKDPKPQSRPSIWAVLLLIASLLFLGGTLVLLLIEL